MPNLSQPIYGAPIVSRETREEAARRCIATAALGSPETRSLVCLELQEVTSALAACLSGRW